MRWSLIYSSTSIWRAGMDEATFGSKFDQWINFHELLHLLPCEWNSSNATCINVKQERCFGMDCWYNPVILSIVFAFALDKIRIMRDTKTLICLISYDGEAIMWVYFTTWMSFVMKDKRGLRKYNNIHGLSGLFCLGSAAVWLFG